MVFKKTKNKNAVNDNKKLPSWTSLFTGDNINKNNCDKTIGESIICLISLFLDK